MLLAAWFCREFICFFKQRTASELRISDWSSDVCSADRDHAHEGRNRNDRREPEQLQLDPELVEAGFPGSKPIERDSGERQRRRHLALEIAAPPFSQGIAPENLQTPYAQGGTTTAPPSTHHTPRGEHVAHPPRHNRTNT